MKKIILFALLSLGSWSAFAQDDLMDLLNADDKKKVNYTTATFKSTRVINGHSNETMRKKHLDFRISHRFGTLNSGISELFGLDFATMRMGFEYGLTDDIMVGIGRSTTDKVYDGFVKAKILKQSTGAKNMPISLTVLATGSYTSIKNFPGVERFQNAAERLAYCTQVVVARKFNDKFSLQLSPTFLHRNKVELATDQNDIFALGIGARYKISKRTSLNAEYFYVPKDQLGRDANGIQRVPSLSLGVDIETGGHVFQLHFTNSLGMVERQFLAETTQSWADGSIHYGFNISRTFSFDGKKRKK
jgi:hypothetical protein